jgi:protease I
MKKMLIFLENGFEDSEFIYPYYRFQEEDYKLDIAATKAKQQYTGEHGVTFTSDLSVDEVDLNDYDAVIVPGGKGPDRMRLNSRFAEIVSDANQRGMVIAAICHGPQVLISADVVRRKTMTSWPSVRVDLKNAGANVVDQPAVTDGNIVTSRWPADLPDFCAATINLLHKIQGTPSRTAPIPAS